MKKYLFIMILSLLTLNSFSQSNEEEDDQPRKVRYGFRVNTPLMGGNYVDKSKEKLYNLDLNLLVKFKIASWLFFQPEFKLPLGTDSINLQANLIIKLGGWEVLGGAQYNFVNNKYSSQGLNIGLNKRIIPPVTIGIGCYLPGKNIDNISDEYVFSTFKPSNLYLNIQFRF